MCGRVNCEAQNGFLDDGNDEDVVDVVGLQCWMMVGLLLLQYSSNLLIENHDFYYAQGNFPAIANIFRSET